MDNHIESITGVSQRPTISQTGAPTNEVVISFVTVFGVTGQIIIPEREYNILNDDELRDKINLQAINLDRPHMLTLGA